MENKNNNNNNNNSSNSLVFGRWRQTKTTSASVRHVWKVQVAEIDEDIRSWPRD